MKNLKNFIVICGLDLGKSKLNLSVEGTLLMLNAGDFIKHYVTGKTLIICSTIPDAHASAEIIGKKFDIPVEATEEVLLLKGKNIPAKIQHAYSYLETRQEGENAESLIYVTNNFTEANHLLFMALEKSFPDNTISKIFIGSFDGFKPGMIAIVDLIEHKIIIPSPPTLI